MSPGEVSDEIKDGKATLTPLNVSYIVTVMGLLSRSAHVKGIVILWFIATSLLEKGIVGDEIYGAVFVTTIDKGNLTVTIESERWT